MKFLYAFKQSEPKTYVTFLSRSFVLKQKIQKFKTEFICLILFIFLFESAIRLWRIAIKSQLFQQNPQN